MNKYFALLAIAFAAVVSCQKPDDQKEAPEELTVTPASIEFLAEGETQTFTVKSNRAWILSAPKWITLSTKGENASEVSVTVAATASKNAETEKRTGKIEVKLASGTVQEIQLTQEAYIAPPGIYNASDFSGFAAALKEETPDLSPWTGEDGVIRLYDDIDVSSLECFPIPEFPADAVLDGQNHTITMNLVSTALKVGLFTTFKGTAKNLTLAGQVTVAGTLEAETHIGSLAANSLLAVIDNCQNYTSISLDIANSDAKVCVIAGGFIGKATGGISFKDCTNQADITFKSAEAAQGAYYMLGGLVGAYGGGTDAGVLSVEKCKNLANFDVTGGDKGNWNYLGGLVGQAQSGTKTSEGGADYSVLFDACEFTGDVIVKGVEKTRIGGICGRLNAYNKFSNCRFSGSISLNASALERNVGGITSYHEYTCVGMIDACVFDGKITSAEGQTKACYYGGIISSGCNEASVIQNCKSTKKSYICNTMMGNAGMMMAAAKYAVNIQNCKIAGTINTDGKDLVISAENLTDDIIRGGGTSAAVATGCSFNAE